MNLLVLGQGDRVERLGAVRSNDLVGAAGALVVGPERDAASGRPAFVASGASPALSSVAGVGQTW